MVEDIVSKLLYAPSVMAAAGAVTDNHVVQEHIDIPMSLGSVNWSNWAVVLSLSIVSFFLKRLVDKIDNTKLLAVDVDRRLLVVETHMENCEWNKKGRRSYDPKERTGKE